MSAANPTVLFLCADNSIRSQLGEALLRRRAGDRFEVHSAGLTSKPVHPLVSEVLREIGLDVVPTSSKRLARFLGKSSVRYAVILRDPAETDAPRVFPFAARTFHWNVSDPTAPHAGSDEERDRFRCVRDVIDTHVREWVSEMDSPERAHSAA